jgi:hypothetical protein
MSSKQANHKTVVTKTNHNAFTCACKSCANKRMRVKRQAETVRARHMNQVKRADRFLSHLNGYCILGRDRTVNKVKEAIAEKAQRG